MTSDGLGQPRAWRRLDEQQQALAAEIARRAMELREASDGELSLRAAIELAADAVQRRGLSAAARPSKVDVVHPASSHLVDVIHEVPLRAVADPVPGEVPDER